MKLTPACALIALMFVTEYLSAENCAVEYTKIGCFEDRVLPDDSLSTELMHNSEPENSIWDLNNFEWKKWPGSLETLACTCAEKAKLLGNNYFGLYFYGKCWSGSVLNHNNQGELSEKCISKDFKKCNDSSSATCVGKKNTNYIYSLIKGEKYSINGNWSEWSEWTGCSATCDGGIRSRSQIYMGPKVIGSYCGRREENQPCNQEVCASVCTNQIEIAFLLDASTSVTSVDWNKTLDFVQDYSKQFKMGLTGVRFAVIEFADEATLEISISDPKYWDQEAFSEKVSSIPYSHGKTRTDLAIEVARTQVFCNECGLRPNVPKLLIVLTDGQSTSPHKTLVEAQRIKVENKLTIISVGVGYEVDIEELKSLATDKDRAFVLNSYSYLNDKINSILKVSCIDNQTTPIDGGWSNWSEWTVCSASCQGGIRIRERFCDNPPPQNGGSECIGEAQEETTCNEEFCEPVCTAEMEIAILLDASTSIFLNNWNRTLEFVLDFSQKFKMGPTGARFAVIDFSDEATLQINISDPRFWSNEGFYKKIKSLEYAQGKTRTNLALQLTREKVFCEKCGLRKNVPKLVIVITDGESTDLHLTLKETHLLKNQANIICIGVGDLVNIKELNDMATDLDHVFLLDGYKYINDKVNQILKMSCKEKKTPINGGWSNWNEWTECSASCNGGIRIRIRLCNNPLPQNGGINCKGESQEETTCNEEKCEPVCDSELDIAILLDASSSVTWPNWLKTLAFVQKFSKEFEMGPTGIRFAVIEFSDRATLQVDISDPTLWNNEAFNKKISKIAYTRGKTRTDFALYLTREKVFCKKCGLRVNVPKLVIVVTDGRSTAPSLTQREAYLLKNLATIISVGVGDQINKNELNTLATDKNHVFFLEGYNYLNDKINRMLKTSCNHGRKLRKRSFTF